RRGSRSGATRRSSPAAEAWTDDAPPLGASAPPVSEVLVSAFDGPGSRPRLERVARPPVPPRAALIRIEACGVCGTDLHILKGHWPRPLPWPITLGQERAGVVEELGDELRADFMGR